MPNSHASRKVHDVLLNTDNFSAEAISLAGVNLSSRSTSSNSASILSSVLENGETIVDVLDSGSVRIGQDDRDDSTHVVRILCAKTRLARESVRPK